MRRASKLMTENREKESEARMRCMPDAEPRGLDRASREARMPDAMQSLEALYLHNSRRGCMRMSQSLEAQQHGRNLN